MAGFPSFPLAMQFLTVIPLPGGPSNRLSPRDLARSMRWYPIVGLLLGSVLVAGDVLVSQVFSPFIVNLLLIIVLVILTGGLHQDGLADTVDGLAGGRTREQRLTIMRDGYIGAIGATGLMLSLGLKYTGLLALPQADRVSLLLCLPAMGRWSLVVATVYSSYPRSEGGLAAPFLAELTMTDVLWATIPFGVGLCWLLGPVQGMCLLLSIGLMTRLCVWFACRVFGGVTGDVLGAINEMTEISFLLWAPLLLMGAFSL